MPGATCGDCGKALGFVERLSGNQCGECRRKAKMAAEEARIKATAEKLEARQSFPERLQAALADGKIEPWEREELDALVTTGQLSSLEVKNVSLKLYEEARKGAIGDRVLTQEEYDYLMQLQTELGIDNSENSRNLRELTRLRLLTEIRDGYLPEEETASIILKRGEICHIELPATLVDEKTISRTIVADASNRQRTRGNVYEMHTKSLNVMTTYQTEERQFLPVDQGTLLITSQRLVFSGQRETIAIPFEKLVSKAATGHGIRLGVEGRKTVRLVQVADEEIVSAIIDQASGAYHDSMAAFELLPKKRGKKGSPLQP